MLEDAIGLISAALMVLVLGIVVWVLWAAWSDSQRLTLELKRDDWKCTKSESRTHLQPMLVGKVTTLITMTKIVCSEYTRISD